MGKNIIITESAFKKIVSKGLKENLAEGIDFSDPNWSKNFFNSLTDTSKLEEKPMPEDICEWGRKVQALGLELSKLCGKYKGTDEYEVLSEIENEYNAVCGDLNTYSIASHWSC